MIEYDVINPNNENAPIIFRWVVDTESELSNVETNPFDKYKMAFVKDSKNVLICIDPDTREFNNVSDTRIGTMAYRDVYISQNNPDNSIGNDGDIWYQY